MEEVTSSDLGEIGSVISKSSGQSAMRGSPLLQAMYRIAKLIASVPGQPQGQDHAEYEEAPISTASPATILCTHPDTAIYLDPESAAELDGLV
jgi:hypothetical protein